MALSRKRKNIRRKTRYRRKKLRGGGPFFSKAYVINLDASTERLKKIQDDAAKAGIELIRFPGVSIDTGIVKDHVGRALLDEGIGSIVYLNEDSSLRHRGTIGCYLSHKRLLEKISADPNAGSVSLILEDDAIIPENLNDKMSSTLNNLPQDWDMCFLGKFPVAGKKVAENILKLDQPRNLETNYGTWAYLVKNSSLKERILPTFKLMVGALDHHYNYFQDVLNIYLIEPLIVDVNRNVKSNIVSVNKDV
jgi:GR25 family glycosyltransferase involved in LPS biosynthesis